MNLKTCFLVLFIYFVCLSGCVEKADEIKVLVDEDLDNLVGYIFADKSTYVVDLKENSILREIRAPERIKNIFFTDIDKPPQVGGKFLWELYEEDFQKITTLPDNCIGILELEEQIYVVRSDRLTDSDGNTVIEFIDSPKKFKLAFDRLWFLDENGFSVYRVSDFMEERRIPIEAPLDFDISQYGIRLYIARDISIDVFDTKHFTLITTISIKDSVLAIKYSKSSDKLFCLGRSGVYQINRVSNRIEHIVQIKGERGYREGGVQFVLSNSGKIGAILLDSTTAFFKVKDREVSKYLDFRSEDIAITPLESKIYCLTPDGLITLMADNFEISARNVITGGHGFIIKRKELQQVVGKDNLSEDSKHNFVIQFEVGTNIDFAKSFVGLLFQSYYPAWVFSAEDGYKVRVGLFNNKEDAEIFDKDIKLVSGIGTKLTTIVKVPYIFREINIPIRDINMDGLANHSIQLNGKTIIIFELLDNRTYRRIYSTTKDTVTYSGRSEIISMEILQGKDNKFVVRTPLVSKGFSFIEYSEGRFVEKYE